MMQLKCPFCGLRDEIEFTWGGQAHISRPDDPTKLTDEQWAEYLFIRKNPKGEHDERWCHTYGCGQWFNICRDTISHKINRVYSITEDAEDLCDD